MSPLRLSALLLTAPSLILKTVAQEPFYQPERLGLFSAPEFQRHDGYAHSEVTGTAQNGWVWGHSWQYDGSPEYQGSSGWVTSVATGETHRPTLPPHLVPALPSTRLGSSIHSVTESGIVTGQTSLSSTSGLAGLWGAAWISRAPNGVAKRIGLIDAAHTEPTGYQSSRIHGRVSPAGYCAGESSRHAHGSHESSLTLWVANADGLTTRIGMPDSPEFTRKDGFSDSQFSPFWESFVTPFWPGGAAVQISASGLIRGHTRRYNNQVFQQGTAAWVASAATGGTARVGFFDMDEFRSPSNIQESYVSLLTDNGLCAGTSTRFDRQTVGGQTAWVSQFDGHTATTRRIGFYDIGEFVGRDGVRYSQPMYVSPTGWVAGQSQRFHRDGTGFWRDAGLAVWVADAATGETTRLGLFGTPEYRGYGDHELSTLNMFFDAGVVAGHANLMHQDEIVGTAAWVATVTDREPRRIGLFGTPEFTGARGAASSILTVDMIGWDLPLSRAPRPVITGRSKRYPDNPMDLGHAVWMADGMTGQTVRIGLFDGPEFIGSNGYQSSEIRLISNSTHVGGTTALMEPPGGQAAWVAELGAPSRRVGLYHSPEFTFSDGSQTSGLSLQTQSGYYAGYSYRFTEGSPGGIIAWIANLQGETIRLGHTDSAHTAADGSQQSTVVWLKESGFAAGSSNRYYGRLPLTWDAATAWLYDPVKKRQINFTLSVREGDGYAKSTVHQLLENGTALGSYAAFDGSTPLGDRAFVHVPAYGTFDLGAAAGARLSEAGWAALSSAQWLLHDDVLIGYGVPLTGGGQGVFASRLNLTPDVRIHSKAEGPGGATSFDLVWPSGIGSTFSIESSHDLSHWSARPETITASTSEVRITVEAPPDQSSLFWRVRRTP